MFHPGDADTGFSGSAEKKIRDAVEAASLKTWGVASPRVVIGSTIEIQIPEGKTTGKDGRHTRNVRCAVMALFPQGDYPPISFFY